MSIKIVHTLPNSGANIMYISNIDQGKNKPPIIITHGTFSNYRVCLGLAQKLAKDGFPCYVMEWPQRSGRNRMSSSEITFDSIGVINIFHIFDYLELAARIKARLRRSKSYLLAGEVFEVGNLRFNPEKREVEDYGDWVILTKKMKQRRLVKKHNLWQYEGKLIFYKADKYGNL